MKKFKPLNRLEMICSGLCVCLHDAKCINDDITNTKEIIRLIEQAMAQVRKELLIQKEQS